MKCVLTFALGLGLAAAFSAVAGEVRFLAWDQDLAQRELVLVQGNEQSPIAGMHHLRRSQLVVFAPDPDAPLALGEEGREDLLPLEIPPGLRSPLVLLAPGEDDAPLGLQAHVIEDDTKGFGWGTFRIFNLTQRDLLLATSDQRVDLPAGWKPADFRLPNGDNEGVIIALEEKDNGHTVLYSSVWMAAPDTRRLVFIAPSADQRLGVLKLHVVPEFFSADATTEERP